MSTALGGLAKLSAGKGMCQQPLSRRYEPLLSDESCMRC